MLRLLPSGLLTAAVLGLLFWLTLAPHPLPEEDIPAFPGADKVAHAVMFGGVYFVMMFDWTGWKRRRGDKTATAGTGVALAAAGMCVALGGGIELLQEGMGLGRGCEWWDFVADIAGVALSVWVSPPVIRWLEGQG